MGPITHRRARRARRDWHDHAAALYVHLAAGGTPPLVEAPGQAGLGPVHLDVTATIAAFHALDVTPPDQPAYLVPVHPAAALITALIARARMRRLAEQAASAAAPQWRDHVAGRVLVTDQATWCRVHGTWQAYPHRSLTGYHLHTTTSQDVAVLDSDRWAPRALTTPAAWTHAVLLAWLRPPTDDWRQAPWLDAVRRHAAHRT